jgi:hypothetical protein
MISLRECLRAGAKPSAAFRELYGNIGSSDLILRVDQDLDGIPTTVLHAIANWNRGRIAGREHMGLNDDQFDEAVTKALLEKLNLHSK